MSKLLPLTVLAVFLGLPFSRADEQSVAPGVDSAALFKQLDTSGDGLLAGDEIPEDKQSLFERLVRLGDGNADGKLSADEFAAGLAGGNKPAAAGSGTTERPATAKPGRPGKAERPGPGRLFARLDSNQDGKVVLEEVPAERRDLFAKMIERKDKDGDSSLSLTEFAPDNPVRPASAAFANRDPSQLFKRIDSNADGKVVADEAPEARREYIARMIERGDKDGDAALTLEEFTTIANRARPDQPRAAITPKPEEAKSETAEVAKKVKKNAGKKAARAGAMPAGLFALLDADGDGQLNDGEIEASSTAIRKLDKDGNGSITLREAGVPAKNKRKKKDN